MLNCCPQNYYQNTKRCNNLQWVSFISNTSEAKAPWSFSSSTPWLSISLCFYSVTPTAHWCVLSSILFGPYLTNSGHPRYPGIGFRAGVWVLFTEKDVDFLINRVVHALYPVCRNERGLCEKTSCLLIALDFDYIMVTAKQNKEEEQAQEGGPCWTQTTILIFLSYVYPTKESIGIYYYFYLKCYLLFESSYPQTLKCLHVHSLWSASFKTSSLYFQRCLYGSVCTDPLSHHFIHAFRKIMFGFLFIKACKVMWWKKDQ